ncbi:hypothetical protein N7471_003529 [Penicillium samsonianum]|uniref:uncharacterized protein n=1 Tax=Penicillium samsonianum TaxID=1882272 RepID=UPI0025490101|nr:uncharacterized protein N7471_003529 [Penicillium samsonianum]KAJ6144076.1 hypothetical protein N7471_003529 [Penicillium samsonianum]
MKCGRQAVWTGTIQEHAGDEGFFIAGTWDCFILEPDLRGPNKTSKMAPFEAHGRSSCSSRKPVVPIQHMLGLGDVDFEIVTDSIGQTE